MLTEVALTRRLIANLEQEASLPTKAETAACVARLLAKPILKIFKEELAEDRRARRKDVQE